MGTFIDTLRGRHIWLRSVHVFGRSHTRSDTYLDDPSVSVVHAVVRHRQGSWLIADHSLNGTLLDGQPLPKGLWAPLATGQEVRFGPGRAPCYRVGELTPPTTALVPDSPEHEAIPLVRSQALPEALGALALIYQSSAGHWWLENEQGERLLEDGSAAEIAGRRYRLRIDDAMDDTAGSPATVPGPGVSLRFTVSSDEEHTRLEVAQGTRWIDLGERSHHYCLLTLARQRIADARAGLRAAEQGWLTSGDLAAMLRIDPAHLNVHVFRARSQLVAAIPGATSFEHLIERRRGALRLGMVTVEIVRGSREEARYSPEPPRASA